MKIIITGLILSVATFIFVSCISSTTGEEKSAGNKDTISNNSVSVLELFTSQGCSSCPPADRLLGRYANMQNVIALSYHVDYWNRLGWKDPFSSSAFSQRQSKYSQLFRLSGSYTPQLVINGEKEMVGSDEDKIVSQLKKEHGKSPVASINLNEVKTGDDKVTISYNIKGDANNSSVNIALVQNKITTSIKAGENSGVDLTNYNVVRNFKTIPATGDETNTATIDLIKGVDKKDLSVVVFLQNSNTYKITAATKSAL